MGVDLGSCTCDFPFYTCSIRHLLSLTLIHKVHTLMSSFHSNGSVQFSNQGCDWLRYLDCVLKRHHLNSTRHFPHKCEEHPLSLRATSHENSAYPKPLWPSPSELLSPLAPRFKHATHILSFLSFNHIFKPSFLSSHVPYKHSRLRIAIGCLMCYIIPNTFVLRHYN